MSGQRTPKREHPDQMCFECRRWEPCHLDWGDCFWMCEAVPGDEYRMTYAYEPCCFHRKSGGTMFEKRERD